MDTKTVFAALFLLFVLYVVGVGIGAGNNGVRVDIDQPGWTEWLSSLMDRPLHPEDVEEVSGTRPDECLEALRDGLFILDVNERCEFTVEETASRFHTRTLRLRLTQGPGAVLVLDPRDEDSAGGSSRLRPGDEEPHVARFLRGGGTVSIACAGRAGECHIQVEE